MKKALLLVAVIAITTTAFSQEKKPSKDTVVTTTPLLPFTDIVELDSLLREKYTVKQYEVVQPAILWLIERHKKRKGEYNKKAK